MKARGFTLIELLVSLAVLGLLLGVIVQWQSSTLNISARTGSLSQLVAELNDASGYVGDKVRGASQLIPNIGVNGSPCDLFAANLASRCLALVVPEVSAGSGSINRVMFYAYRLMNRAGSCCANDVTPDAWANANARVLVEYRQQLCAPCTTAARPFLVSGADPNVVLDYATTDGMTTLFGALDASGGPCADPVCASAARTLTLQFRTKRRAGGAVSAMPPAAPLDLRVLMRNR